MVRNPLFGLVHSVPTVAPVYIGSQVTSTSITFSWNRIPCGMRGGAIAGYFYQVHDAMGIEIQSRSVDTLDAEVTGLLPCSLYTFRVRAHTRFGPGPWLESIYVETSAIGRDTRARS